MKQFFKYEFGYINIDEDNLYMTNSGNWTEIIECQEKTGFNKMRNNTRMGLNTIFLVIALIIGLVILFAGIKTNHLSFTPFVLVPIGGYYLYRYMQRDLGPKYKIPISKVISIDLQPEEKKVILRFLNGSDEKDQQILLNVEKKGFEVLGGIHLKP